MREVRLEGLKMVFQGDIMIRRSRTGVPAGARRVEGDVVAHSETGHHHVVRGGKAFATENPMLLHVVAERAEVDFLHLRDFDTHETIRLVGDPGETYDIVRQREDSPWGERMVAD